MNIKNRTDQHPAKDDNVRLTRSWMGLSEGTQGKVVDQMGATVLVQWIESDDPEALGCDQFTGIELDLLEVVR